jgi:hypothetical protein
MRVEVGVKDDNSVGGLQNMSVKTRWSFKEAYEKIDPNTLRKEK